MSKSESLIMKGVAILLMIYLHLFNHLDKVELCSNLFYIGDTPLTYLLTRAASPVSFFIILSGYGLYVSHHKGTYRVWHKLKMLYVHYWLTLLIFVTLGFWVVGSDKYPGDWVNILNNVTAWDVSYNSEIWFLFPYIMVMLTSKWLVKLIDRFNPWLFSGVTLFLALCCGFLISRYGAQYIYDHQLVEQPILYVSFLFSFTIGAYMAKCQLVSKLKFGGGVQAPLGGVRQPVGGFSCSL